MLYVLDDFAQDQTDDSQGKQANTDGENADSEPKNNDCKVHAVTPLPGLAAGPGVVLVNR